MRKMRGGDASAVRLRGVHVGRMDIRHEGRGMTSIDNWLGMVLESRLCGFSW